MQKDGHPIENTALYIRTIVDAWIKAEKPVSELKEEFRKGNFQHIYRSNLSGQYEFL